MSQSPGPRIISKFVEGVTAGYDSGSSTWAMADITNRSGWSITNTGILQWQGYIDLHGWRPDDMVLYPTAVQCQYGAPFLSYGVNAWDQGGPMYLQYAVTTDKIDDLDVGSAGVAEPLAGYIGDNSEMDQVVFGCSEVYAPTQSIYALQKVQKHMYGDAVPIVGPRLYISIRCALTIPRNAANTANTNGAFSLPPMRFVIAGEVRETNEFILLHLMKRQIALQQSSDVDL